MVRRVSVFLLFAGILAGFACVGDSSQESSSQGHAGLVATITDVIDVGISNQFEGEGNTNKSDPTIPCYIASDYTTKSLFKFNLPTSLSGAQITAASMTLTFQT